MSTTILSGLSVGALYGAVALLMSLPLMRAGSLNFSVAFCVVLGGFVASDLAGEHGLPTLVTLAVLLLLGAAVGLLQDVVIVRPLHKRGQGELVAIVGVVVTIEGVILAVWGTEPRSLRFFGGEHLVEVFGGRVPVANLTMIGATILSCAVVQWSIGATRWGLLGRAALSDHDLSAIRGLNPTSMRRTALVLACSASFALALIAAPMTGVSSNIGLRLVIYSFTAAAIGGFGSAGGALLGGFAIGLVEAFAARYLGANYVNVVVFVILATTLLLAPSGLMGRRLERAV